MYWATDTYRLKLSQAKILKYPVYFPYPISWLRATIQIVSIGLSIRLILGGFDAELWTPIFLLQPFGLVSFLLIPVIISIVLHWITQQLLYAAKGVRKPHPLNSLWEGIYGWMVTIFALTIMLLFLILPLVLTVEWSDAYWDRYPYYYNALDDDIVVAYLGIYFVITAYLYQLEYLIRYPQSLARPLTPTNKKTVAKTTILASSKPTQKPKAPTPTPPENEIETELNYLKNKIKNHNRFGK
ncbi:MAG: hypothetical protein HC799_09630 [Limnothrix sp. RL_2_0]|nr:hypothetical protein [Limnothrix sp. RL_2_0]